MGFKPNAIASCALAEPAVRNGDETLRSVAIAAPFLDVILKKGATMAYLRIRGWGYVQKTLSSSLITTYINVNTSLHVLDLLD